MGQLPQWPAVGGGAGVGRLWTPTGVSDFQELIAASSSRAALVNDPLGSGAMVFRVECDNADVFPKTPTEDPRAQLLSPPLYTTGANIYAAGKVLIPEGFPAVQAGKFFQLMEIFGPPAEGSPPWSLALGNEEGFEHFFWQRNASYEFDMPWAFIPLQRGVWNTWALRITQAGAGAGGRLSWWWNGVQQELFKPATSYNPKGHEETLLQVMSTQDASNNGGPNLLYLGQYRKHETPGMLGTVTVYHGVPSMGLTLGSVL